MVSVSSSGTGVAGGTPASVDNAVGDKVVTGASVSTTTDNDEVQAINPVETSVTHNSIQIERL